MKTLKVLLQEVVSGIKAWVNSNFAQESNTVHKTGNETVNGNKTFTGNVFQNQAGGTNVYCATCDGAVKGDLTSSGTFSIVCKDGSNANMETSGLAAVYMGQDTSGSYVVLRADTSYNNTRYNASVSLDIDPTTANNNAIFRPRRDNTIDLGSSSYQFKDTYTKGLYVDGNQVDPTLFPFMLATDRTVSGGLFPYCKLGYDDYVGKGFNDLTDTGIYRPRTDPTIPNTPDAGTIDGILVVFNAGTAANVSNNRRCRQTYYTFNSNPRTFTRYGVCSSTTGNWTWYDWVEIPTNKRDFIPLADNSINLGSRTNQFSAAYLRAMIMQREPGAAIQENYIRFESSDMTLGAEPPASGYTSTGGIYFSDSNSDNYGALSIRDNSSGNTYMRFAVRQKFTDGVRSTSGSYSENQIHLGVDSTGNPFFMPYYDNTTDLGTADNRWKTFNGLNPGVLSFPDLNNSNRIELQTEETEWIKDGTLNTYTPTLTGWLNIRIDDTVGDFILVQSGSVTVSKAGSGNISATNYGLGVLIPVISGQYCNVHVKTTVVKAFIYPCLGNVTSL